MSHIQETHTEKALSFLFTMRGRYIISQALYYAIRELESVEPKVFQELSNIKDMKYLREQLFDFPDIAFQDTRRVSNGST